MKALIIAGTASSVGKTTVAVGLIAALVRRGLLVQPFKVGPDYIDPSYHTVVAGRTCRNLDSWMLPHETLLELYVRAAMDCDVAIVEGVMGLHDGRTGHGEAGSTAEVAKLLGAPVVLVIDAAKSARSAAAVALGFRQLDPAVHIAGVILNNVASANHEQAIAEPLARQVGLPVLGSLPKNGSWRLDERYLGLVPVLERGLDIEASNQLGDAVEDHFALDRLLAIAAQAGTVAPARRPLFPARPGRQLVRIAVARDAAFSFYYQDNLDLLSAHGAELLEFSPLADERLPPGTAGVYLGGGFPELFARELARNRLLTTELRRAAQAGMPIYAECGGLMYLGRGLVDRDDEQHDMVGAIPGWSSMRMTRLTLGYRAIRSRQDTLLLRRGEVVRGHEFHWSVPDREPDHEHAAYDVLGDQSRREGYAAGNLLASYVHLHFGTNPSLAPRFVERCAAWDMADRAEFGGSIDRRGWATDLPSARHTSQEDAAPAASAKPLPRPSAAAVNPGRRPDLGDANWRPAVGPLLRAHGLAPAEIEPLSERRIRAAVGHHLLGSEDQRALAARLVYAAGDPSIAGAIQISDGFLEAATRALQRRAAVLIDVKMVAAGVNATLLARLGCDVLVAVEQPNAGGLARELGITRSAAGVLSLAADLEGAVVAIGNAPTALLALLDLVQSGSAHPAAVIGLPVGFVAAAEAKQALLQAGVPYLTLPGTRGGSPLAAAALNHLLRLTESPGSIHLDDAPVAAISG